MTGVDGESDASSVADLGARMTGGSSKSIAGNNPDRPASSEVGLGEEMGGGSSSSESSSTATGAVTGVAKLSMFPYVWTAERLLRVRDRKHITVLKMHLLHDGGILASLCLLAQALATNP